MQVAFGRDVPATGSEAALHSRLAWESLPEGGQVAAISLASPGASALRAGFRVIAIPVEAMVRFRAPGSGEMFEVSGEDILDSVARNLEAGDDSADARMYWSPIIEGDTAIVEFELPADARPQDLRIAIPKLSHFVSSPRADPIEKVSSCQLDAVCYDSTWQAESFSVARMFFTIGSSGYVCTGTLLADQDTSTTIPYLLSANHCIGSQTIASTIQVYWKYRSTSCNGGAATSYPSTVGGATLLYNAGVTDTSFMRLVNAPPAGVTYSGWQVSAPALNTSVTGLHNPGGGLEKISFASIYQYATCTPSGGGGTTFSCNSASQGSATFYGVLWNQGLTEGGSSGSGLFLDNGHYLIGQLYGGSSQCGTSSGPDFYGRFDVAYNAALSQWLSPPVRALSVGKAGTGTGTVTSSPSGISCGSTCSASYSQGAAVTLTATPSGGSTFTGWSGACSGTGSCAVTMSGDLAVTASFDNPALVPGAPTNLVATPGNGQAGFTFSPPANTGGSGIASYTVTCSPGSHIGSASASPVSVTGLANGATYTCSATATNATTTGPASNTVTVTPISVPLALSSVVSRKTHALTTYELPIDTTQPVTGAVTVEPRVDNTHRIVFRFNAPVTSAGIITVTDVSGAAIGAASVSVTAAEIVVTLVGVDGRRVRVAIAGVNGTLNVAASVGFLAGDEDSNGRVTAADILRVHGRIGQSVSAANFVYDIDLDGGITTGDLLAAKARSGASLQ